MMVANDWVLDAKTAEAKAILQKTETKVNEMVAVVESKI